MALKILVPVFPSERFYDSVVAAGDLLSREGGIMTFFFTTLRPPPLWEEREDVGFQSEVETDAGLVNEPDETIDAWQEEMRKSLDDAYDLLRERGVADEQVVVLFGDTEGVSAQTIADEAAAGAYDVVILPKGIMIDMTDEQMENPRDVAQAVRELADDGVRLLVT